MHRECGPPLLPPNCELHVLQFVLLVSLPPAVILVFEDTPPLADCRCLSSLLAAAPVVPLTTPHALPPYRPIARRPTGASTAVGSGLALSAASTEPGASCACKVRAPACQKRVETAFQSTSTAWVR
eukprot:gnl/TRDRNA2_/TRDRNA2_169441_c0_seq8.p2 gnl/TRDRNA2_/TRDRNA2_169441_c0~~gnl/TRDRNA2_/TRDRNA2_169441_c0_seq8.p2  ORF type:complete len:126 (+),score=10.77 gnl/TRDRNA2_/TRDRNA2_169441_c0_seq8:244-621(+)